MEDFFADHKPLSECQRVEINFFEALSMRDRKNDPNIFQRNITNSPHFVKRYGCTTDYINATPELKILWDDLVKCKHGEKYSPPNSIQFGNVFMSLENWRVDRQA